MALLTGRRRPRGAYSPATTPPLWTAPACPGGLDLDWDTQGISPQEYSGAAPEFGSYTSRASVSTGFSSGNGFGDTLSAVTPQLSANGMTVALLVHAA